jgi:hypothetical protein
MMEYFVPAILLILKSTLAVEGNATRSQVAAAFFWNRTAQRANSHQQICTRIPIARPKLAKQVFIVGNIRAVQTPMVFSIAFICIMAVEWGRNGHVSLWYRSEGLNAIVLRLGNFNTFYHLSKSHWVEVQHSVFMHMYRTLLLLLLLSLLHCFSYWPKAYAVLKVE